MPDGPGASARALRGAVWLAGGAVVVRGASLLAQLVLGKLLLKDDFGLYALTVTVWMFVQLLTNPGLDDVLVARRTRLHLWVSPAVWVSLALGVVGTLAMLAAAPVAGWAYGDDRVVPLVMVTALAAVPMSLAMVPGAILRARQRFAVWAAYLTVTQVAQFALQVGLAVAGWGAAAFVVPIPIVAAGGAVFLWMAARPEVKRRPQVRRWRYLWGDGGPLLGVRAVQTLQANADRMVLGWVAATAVVGVYAFAYQIATQITRVLAANLNQALLPGLSGLRDEPGRQLAGTLAASRMVGLVGVPVACVQAACVGPLLRLLFGEKWEAAIVPAQILSLAAGIDCMAWAGASLMQAQRRLKLMLGLQVFSCLAMLVMLGLAGWLAPEGKQAVAVAGAMGAYLCVLPTVNFAAVVRASGGRWGDLLRVYGPPVMMGVPTAAAAFAAAGAVPGVGARVEVLRMLAAAGAGGLVYGGLALLVARPLVMELVTRVREALARKTAGKGARA